MSTPPMGLDNTLEPLKGGGPPAVHVRDASRRAALLAPARPRRGSRTRTRGAARRPQRHRARARHRRRRPGGRPGAAERDGRRRGRDRPADDLVRQRDDDRRHDRCHVRQDAAAVQGHLRVSGRSPGPVRPVEGRAAGRPLADRAVRLLAGGLHARAALRHGHRLRAVLPGHPDRRAARRARDVRAEHERGRDLREDEGRSEPGRPAQLRDHRRHAVLGDAQRRRRALRGLDLLTAPRHGEHPQRRRAHVGPVDAGHRSAGHGPERLVAGGPAARDDAQHGRRPVGLAALEPARRRDQLHVQPLLGRPRRHVLPGRSGHEPRVQRDDVRGARRRDAADLRLRAGRLLQPAPPPGSYLATHWNVYNNLFMAECGTLPAGTCITSGPTDPPSNTAPPSIVGTPATGELLSADKGTWDGAVSYGYVWLRDGATITGAASSSYRVTSADRDAMISVRVTGVNPWGTVAETSAEVGPVAPRPPVLAVDPAVSGTLTSGSLLTTTIGTWSPVGTTYTFQWERSVGGAAFAPIPGANRATYRLVVADN